jgi:hypothetical protein
MGNQDLIFSRNFNDGFMSPADISTKAPAAFTGYASPERSSRYGYLSTGDAIDILDGYGYGVTQAAQKRSRKIDGQNYAEHMLAFSQRGDAGNAGEFRAELILYNSHDGTSSLKLFAGCYRFICSNGLISGDGIETRLRHSMGNAAGFESMVSDIAGELPRLMERIFRLQDTKISEAAAQEIAIRAAGMRWNDSRTIDAGEEIPRGAYFTARTVSALNAANRYGDAGPNAWLAFNRVQENVIRGGAPILSVTDKKPGGNFRKARGITSVRDNVKINRSLWDAAEEIAGIAE